MTSITIVKCGRQVNSMKKLLITIAALVFCFLFSSFGQSVLYPFANHPEIALQPDENTQKAYAIMDAVDNYTAPYLSSDNHEIDKLANILSSNMIVNFNDVKLSIEANASSPTITAFFIDWGKIALLNNTIFEFSSYNDYVPSLSYDAMQQIYQIANNSSLYTNEYEIRVTFKTSADNRKVQALLNYDDLVKISDECYIAAEQIYTKYISTSDMSTAFFCKSIKELTTNNIVDIYNTNNPDNQITDEWKRQLFTTYSQHYIDNLIIENIIKASSEGQTSKGTINYKSEQGNLTINSVLTSLLEHYYDIKQPPILKDDVIKDFGVQLASYSYADQASLISKSFDFTYTQNLNEFIIQNDFYTEIVSDIYEEFILFEDIFNTYYPQIEGLYFFEPRPFNSTTILIDKTGNSRYRQVDIVVSGLTDCYIKLYSYDTVNDILIDTVFAAYIKSGESLQIFIPEGDYVFKYATGQMWYGDLYKFSDEGQYYMSSNVISVHEYLMTTKIELGNLGGGSIPVNSQTPDLF